MTPPLPFPALIAAAVQAGWVGPTAALSLVIIALSFIAIAVTIVLAGRGTAQAVQKLSDELGEMRSELHGTLHSVREVAEQGRDMAGQVREEVRAVIATSQRIRHDVERGVRRARRRLQDLDALAEVVQEEIADTALDVTATLRGVRRGAGMVTRLRRWLRRGRR
jgi:uncharacterized protein YoxC